MTGLNASPVTKENDQALFGFSAGFAAVLQPPLPLQSFLPLQSLVAVLQPPWPLQSFLPLQSCALPSLPEQPSLPLQLSLAFSSALATAVPALVVEAEALSASEPA